MPWPPATGRPKKTGFQKQSKAGSFIPISNSWVLGRVLTTDVFCLYNLKPQHDETLRTFDQDIGFLGLLCPKIAGLGRRKEGGTVDMAVYLG